MVRRTLIFLGPLILVLPSRAEFRLIEQPLAGLECASCARSVTAAIGRMRGVEAVDVTAEGTARVRLKPANKIRLEVIRDAVKGAGFTPQDATVNVRGQAIPHEGRWEFRIDGLDQVYLLAFDARDEKSLAEIRRRAGEVVVLEGVVPPSADPRAQPVLRVTAVASDLQP